MQETENTTELTAEEAAALVADAPSPDRGEDGGGGEEFIPTDAAGVDWVLRKMADARTRASRIRENAEKMARAEERDAEFLEWHYGAALQAYVRAELAGGKKRSVRLYHGQLGFRTKPAGVCVTNPAAALAWAKEHLPAAVAEKLDKAALAEKLLETGEAPDFAQLVPAEDIFYIKS